MTLPPQAPTTPKELIMATARAIFVTLVFAVFTVFSLFVIRDRGYIEAFTIPFRGGWNAQEFLDLCISLFVASTWMRRDAQKKNLPFWPFAIACVPLGSISLLAYATWSSWVDVRSIKKSLPDRSVASAA
jgi:hypothetical protein